MSPEKSRHTVWLTDEVWERVRTHYREDSCTTKNEFVEKALRFYLGFLTNAGEESFLPRVISAELEGTVGVMANRIGRLLFKQSVELGILSHLIAADTEVDQATLKRLRGRCVDDVKRTNGQIEFKEILQFQREE